MKIIHVVFLLIGFGIFVGCKKDDKDPVAPTVSGCTDASAVNYDESANLDDGSCTYNYQSTISFWQDFSSSQDLQAAEYAGFVRVYIDGVSSGTFQSDLYSAVEPPCGNGISVHTVSLGNSQSGSVQYDLRYYDGISAWVVFQNGTIDLTANGCASQQIIF